VILVLSVFAYSSTNFRHGAYMNVNDFERDETYEQLSKTLPKKDLESIAIYLAREYNMTLSEFERFVLKNETALEALRHIFATSEPTRTLDEDFMYDYLHKKKKQLLLKY